MLPLLFTACHKEESKKHTAPKNDPIPFVSPFKTCLEKTDEDIQDMLDNLWNHYFKGDDDSKLYYERSNEAYILEFFSQMSETNKDKWAAAATAARPIRSVI